MKKIAAVAVVLFLVVFSANAWPQELKTPVHLRVASLDLGSAGYVYAATFANLWRMVLPKGSTIDVLPFAGVIGNALILGKGDADEKCKT